MEARNPAATPDGPVPGDEVNRLMPLVYDQLRQLAASHLQRESPGHSIQATALANEVYLKLAEQTRVDWTGRAHLIGVATTLIRRILVDHARARSAQKRGAGRVRITISDLEGATRAPDFDILDLNEALAGLQQRSPRQAKVVELKFFGGLSNQEIADTLSISETLVKNEWRFARAWLAARLGSGDSNG